MKASKSSREHTSLDSFDLLWKLLSAAILIILTAVSLESQAQAQSDGVTVTRNRSQIEFKSSSGRSLYLASRAISSEYGWIIDYEETVIAPSDVEDSAPAEWKAAHPFKIGFLEPKQEDTILAVPNDRLLREDKDKSAVLQSLVKASSLNRTSRIRVTQTEPDGRATIIDAQPADQKPIGSYEIHQEAGLINGMLFLDSLVTSCSTASGHTLSMGTMPVNMLGQITFQRSEGQVTCRAALIQLLNKAPYKLAYSILYDPQNVQFVLNIEPVRHTTISRSGELKSPIVRNPLP